MITQQQALEALERVYYATHASFIDRNLVRQYIIEQSTAQPQAVVPAPEKYDDVLQPFLTLMRKELHANSSKGDRPGWLAMDANTALLEVYWHTAKLSAAVKNNDGPAIQEHSADVANMAMMVLDVCGGLALVQDSPVATGAVTPCGGCGETKESSRCIGCAHQFSAAPQPQQEQP